MLIACSLSFFIFALDQYGCRVSSWACLSLCLWVCLSLCLCVCLSDNMHISGTACPNFAKFSSLLPVVMALSHSGIVVKHYIMYFQCVDDAVFSYSSSFTAVCVQPNTPAACYWLNPVLVDTGCQG